MRIFLALLVVLFTTTTAFGAGLEYKGDGQQLKVTNSAGNTAVILKSDGTIDLDGEVVSKTRITGIETDLTTVETLAASIETSLNSGPVALSLGSIENEIDQINSVKLPGKMNNVASPTNNNLIKTDANGQGVDSGIAAGNILLRDGTLDMQGALNMASHKITNLTPGTDANDAATKGQLDAAISGLSWKDPVDEAEVNSASLTGSVVAGYRVLINGVGAGAFETHDNDIAVRNQANDGWDFVDAVSAWALFDEEGDQGFTFTGTAWVQFTGTGMIAAGDALAKVGNTLNVKYNDSTIGVNGSNQLEIKATSIGNGLIAAGAGIVESKLTLDYSTSGLNTAIGTVAGNLSTHTGDATIHRSINDSAASSTGLWSSFKINSELSGKAASVHGHVAADVSDFTSAARGAISVSGGILGYADGVVSLSNSSIDHDSLTNFVANEHNLMDDAQLTLSTLWSSEKTSNEIALQITTALASFSQINDAATTESNLWSALKVNTELGIRDSALTAGLSTKAAAVHTHIPSDILGLNAYLVSSVEAYNLSTSQVILSGGKDFKFVGEKINISEGSAVAFANINVLTAAFVTVEVNATVFASLGKTVESGKWLVTLRKTAAGSVAVSSVQQVALFDGGSEAAAELDLTGVAFTVATVDGDTVALKINAAVDGTDGITEYGIDYSLHCVGAGTAGVVAQ